MSRWQFVLMGMGGVLGIMGIAWFAWGGMSYSTPVQTLSCERKLAEKPCDTIDPQAMEANVRFIERARAIEAGFKAAFPFHK